MKYPGVDVIRLCAALMVVIYHLGFAAWREKTDQPLGILEPFAHWGWVGVPIFFVISGFVIAMSAENKTAKAFAWSRFLRLYPAAWVAATLTFIVAGATTAEYLRSITLFPVGPWVDDVYWTLAVEIVFYGLVALSLRLGVSLRSLALALGLYSAAFWALKAANSVTGLADLSPIENYTGFLLLLHDGVFFAIGMLLWQKRYALMSAFVAVGVVAVAARSQAISEHSALVAPIVWLIATGMVVLSARLGGSWSVRIVGLLTYPLYLIHNEVGRVVLAYFANPWAAVAFAIAVVFLLAAGILVVEQTIKRALIRLGSSQWRQPRRSPNRSSPIP